MRKLFASLALLAISTPALSLPEKPEQLIKALLTSNNDFSSQLARLVSYADENSNASFDSITIKVIDATPQLRERCSSAGARSRSASILEVTVVGQESTMIDYYATPLAARDLRTCAAPRL